MTPPAAAPRRWHVYIVDLEPRVGTKPGKQRPCLAIQPSEFGEGGLRSTVVLPLTTNIVEGVAFPLRVRIRAGICRLARDSDVLVDQISLRQAAGRRAEKTMVRSGQRRG